jgi:SIR2-like domain
VPTGRGRYLSDPALLDAIDRLARERRPITLIVGAGSSIEAELPSWPELVRNLLQGVAPRTPDAARRARWIEGILKEGLPGAAAVAEALIGDEKRFHRRLRTALYGRGSPRRFVAAALAQQVAWLKSKCPNDIAIVTANYDVLLEQALDDLDVPAPSRIEAEPPGTSVAHGVLHLHGRLAPTDGKTGRIVLSEKDYVEVQQPGSWHEQYMRTALEKTVCVFVGLSLSDPNLIRWLYRYRHSVPHVAIFARQTDPEIPLPLREELERATSARWRRVGVEPLWIDFYGEAAQFLHELGLRRSGSSLGSFADRARAAFEQGENVVVPRGAKQFATAQARWAEQLRSLLTWVRVIAAAGGADLAGEQLGLGLWGVDHARGTVSLWATSDRMFKGRDAMVPRPLEYQSRWVAVEAVTRGVTIERDPSVFTSRWRLVRGIPIVIPADRRDGRVVVGAMTLTSQRRAETSGLHRISAGARNELDEYLAGAGALPFEDDTLAAP